MGHKVGALFILSFIQLFVHAFIITFVSHPSTKESGRAFITVIFITSGGGVSGSRLSVCNVHIYVIDNNSD